MPASPATNPNTEAMMIALLGGAAVIGFFLLSGKQAAAPCPTGQTRDPHSGLCLCADGQLPDPTTGLCPPPPQPCPDGQPPDPITGQCPPPPVRQIPAGTIVGEPSGSGRVWVIVNA